jgi:uncharacterized membrane protein YfcA
MEIIIIILAGTFAGVATGLVGLSAAAIIVPLLSTVLGMDPYIAVGIALASDVLASATSSRTYAKSKNIDIKNGLLMMGSVLLFTVISSYVSSLRDTESLGNMMNIVVIFLGISFLMKNAKESKPAVRESKLNPKLSSVLWGSLVGIICGYVGAGGGVMLLVVLTSVLGYELKTAVGTSVFIMTFTALLGAVSHIVIGGTDLPVLIVCVITAFIGAKVSAIYANKISIKKLNAVVGVFLIVFGIVLTLLKQIG